MPESLANWGKLLIFVGFALMALGVTLSFGDKIPLLSKLGRLPLDMKWEGENFKVYFPLGTSLFLSIILTLALKFFGGSSK